MRPLLPILLLSITIAGCDRHKQAAVPTTAPAPATAPASRPSEALGATYIAIDHQTIEFPPAQLKLEKGAQLTALLFSEDPPGPADPAADDKAANSFYLQMPLDITDAAQLSQTTYAYKAASREREDSPNGIFLDHSKKQLQPLMINVQFTPKADVLEITLTGSFLEFDTQDPAIPSKEVLVKATLTVPQPK
ncbi:MAG TPA: hypothetical protein VIL86_09575 [Tepidisphaeraceae bacterium]|jgi:hypothetical protein